MKKKILDKAPPQSLLSNPPKSPLPQSNPPMPNTPLPNTHTTLKANKLIFMDVGR